MPHHSKESRDALTLGNREGPPPTIASKESRDALNLGTSGENRLTRESGRLPTCLEDARRSCAFPLVSR